MNGSNNILDGLPVDPSCYHFDVNDRAQLFGLVDETMAPSAPPPQPLGSLEHLLSLPWPPELHADMNLFPRVSLEPNPPPYEGFQPSALSTYPISQGTPCDAGGQLLHNLPSTTSSFPPQLKATPPQRPSFLDLPDTPWMHSPELCMGADAALRVSSVPKAPWYEGSQPSALPTNLVPQGAPCDASGQLPHKTASTAPSFPPQLTATPPSQLSVKPNVGTVQGPGVVKEPQGRGHAISTPASPVRLPSIYGQDPFYLFDQAQILRSRAEYKVENKEKSALQDLISDVGERPLRYPPSAYSLPPRRSEDTTRKDTGAVRNSGTTKNVRKRLTAGPAVEKRPNACMLPSGKKPVATLGHPRSNGLAYTAGVEDTVLDEDLGKQENITPIQDDANDPFTIAYLLPLATNLRIANFFLDSEGFATNGHRQEQPYPHNVPVEDRTSEEKYCETSGERQSRYALNQAGIRYRVRRKHSLDTQEIEG